MSRAVRRERRDIYEAIEGDFLPLESFDQVHRRHDVAAMEIRIGAPLRGAGHVKDVVGALFADDAAERVRVVVARLG